MSTTKARKPRHVESLELLGWPHSKYLESVRWFAARGWVIGYAAGKRCWFFQRMGAKIDGPTYVTCWLGVEAFVRLLDNQEAALIEFNDFATKGGAV